MIKYQGLRCQCPYELIKQACYDKNGQHSKESSFLYTNNYLNGFHSICVWLHLCDLNIDFFLGDTALHIAISEKQEDIVDLLISKGADIEKKNYEGN